MILTPDHSSRFVDRIRNKVTEGDSSWIYKTEAVRRHYFARISRDYRTDRNKTVMSFTAD